MDWTLGLKYGEMKISNWYSDWMYLELTSNTTKFYSISKAFQSVSKHFKITEELDENRSVILLNKMKRNK